MNNGDFLSDNSPPDRWKAAKARWNITSDPWRKSDQDDPILFATTDKLSLVSGFIFVAVFILAAVG